MKKLQFLKAGDYMKTITRAKYLDRIIELNGTPDIKIITGIRRSGKSKLMQAYIAYLKSNFENINIIFIDFMDLAYEEIKEGKTSPPKHFTEDTLLSAMETAGADEMPDEVERKGLGLSLIHIFTLSFPL